MSPICRVEAKGTRHDEATAIQDLSDYLGVPVYTLYQMARQGLSPTGRRVGKHGRRRASDVDARLDDRWHRRGTEAGRIVVGHWA
jgi:hypothetical protein